MKEIKDYLHLYKYVMCVGKNGLQYKLHGTDENMAVIHERETGRVSITYAGNLQPILRPLGNITKEEQHAALEFGKNYLDTWIGGAERTKYLLSLHFDLFGLVDAGLAIDATTLTP